jgi:hypothetical protein
MIEMGVESAGTRTHSSKASSATVVSMEAMNADEQQSIQDEITALRARSERLLAQSEVLREKSEMMAKKTAEAEAAARRQAAQSK